MTKRELSKITLILTSYFFFLGLSYLLINRYVSLPIMGKVAIVFLVFFGTFSGLLLFLKKSVFDRLVENETTVKKLVYVCSRSLSFFLFVFAIYKDNWYVAAISAIIYILGMIYYVFY